MTELPPTLQESIPAELTSDAIRWWRQLSEADRAELARLCDARKEVFLFETFDPNNERQKITGGRFLPHDDAIGIEEWGAEYFDTLLCNPELMIVYDPPRRTFFIGCHRHPAARNCFLYGKICAGFECPFDDSNCLMNKIRGDRDSIGLRVMLSGQKNSLGSSMAMQRLTRSMRP
jgi:hypothetical protein